MQKRRTLDSLFYTALLILKEIMLKRTGLRSHDRKNPRVKNWGFPKSRIKKHKVCNKETQSL